MNIICDRNTTRYCQNCVSKGQLNVFDVIDNHPEKLKRATKNTIKWNPFVSNVTNTSQWRSILNKIQNGWNKKKRLDKFCLKYNHKFNYKLTIGFSYEDYNNIVQYVINKMPLSKLVRVNYLKQIKKQKDNYEEMMDMDEKSQSDYKYKFYFNTATTKGQNYIKKCIFAWMDFLYFGNGIIIRAANYSYERHAYTKMVIKGAALLENYFTNFLLLNSKSKINQNQDYNIHQILDIDKERDIVFVDGIRFRINKSSNFDMQYRTYSSKDDYNAFNIIGIFTYSGKCIGFYPKVGNFSNGGNGDGFLWDKLIYHEQTQLVKLLPTNNQLDVNKKGTVIFADKAWNLCNDKKFGCHDFVIPNCSNQKFPERQNEANEGRLCTMFRFSIEHSFGIYQKLWKFWKNGFSTAYIKFAASWMNICGAIINFTGYGIKKINPQRSKEIAFMKLRLKFSKIHKHEELLAILNYFRTIPSIKKKYQLTHNVQEPYWKEAETIWDIANDKYHKFWTLKRLELIVTNSSERRLMCGGPYGERLAYPYAFHSRTDNKLSIYYSNHPAYSKYIMVRHIIRKYSPTHKEKNSDPKITHHVLITFRDGDEVIINEPLPCGVNSQKQDITKTFNFPLKVLLCKSICSCRHGSRDISICCHQSCAFYFVQEWWQQSMALKNKIIIENPSPMAYERINMLESCEEFNNKLKLLKENDSLQYNWRYWSLKNS